jgi:hypothetical protein
MGSGAGKNRRPQTVVAPDIFHWNYRLWKAFLSHEGLEDVQAGDYYGINLPERYDDDSPENIEKRCALALELLHDFVATGAFQLPDDVDVSEFSFSINGMYMVMHRKRYMHGYEQTSSYAAIFCPAPTLHGDMKMGGYPMGKILRQLAESVKNLC